MYIYYLSRWIKVGLESRLIKGDPAAALLIDCVGGRLASLRSYLCSRLRYFDVELLTLCEMGWEKGKYWRNWQAFLYQVNVSVVGIITIPEFAISKLFPHKFVSIELDKWIVKRWIFICSFLFTILRFFYDIDI